MKLFKNGQRVVIFHCATFFKPFKIDFKHPIKPNSLFSDYNEGNAIIYRLTKFPNKAVRFISRPSSAKNTY